MGVIGMNLAPNDVIIAMQTASMGEAVLLETCIRDSIETIKKKINPN